MILSVIACPPLVMRTVYSPGIRRGPWLAENATCAAGGAFGAGPRMDQATRLMPGFLEADRVSTTLPDASRTSIFSLPNRARVG